MRVLVTAVATLLVASATASLSGGSGGVVGGSGIVGGGVVGRGVGGGVVGNQGVGLGGGIGLQSGGLGNAGFVDPLSAASAGGYQVGTAQVQQRDQHSARDQTQFGRDRRKFDSSDAGLARADDQQRRGDLRESSFNKNDQQERASSAHEARNFDRTRDFGREQTQRQNDANDKHGIGLENVGRYDRLDAARNAGDKALAQRKNAFARRTNGFENIDYGFAKDFDTNFAERGGFKEAIGQDNNNLDVYEEKQTDNRFSKGLLDAFRRSRDRDAFNRQSDWLSNAAQAQDLNQQYGAADRLQNAAEQQNADRNALLDRRNDKFWHRDNAQDQAVRQAQDLAAKQAANEKRALATASGLKGVKDSKYYGGGTYGRDGGVGGAVALGTAGAGVVSGTGNVGLGSSGGRRTGTGLATGGNVVGTGVGAAPGGVRGRKEGSGGDYVNSYAEDARQSDLSNQLANNKAQSDATALNNYNRERGVDDSVEVTGQQEGLWASQQAGLRDANSQGFNNNDADVAKAAKLADNSVDRSASASSLNAANKNLLAQELDRVNFKRNQVDNNQRVRKQKKFYHDRNEDGFNNEALNYNRNRGNQDWGEEQAAQKEARSRFDNAADDAKVNQQARAFNNLDARRVSNGDFTARQKDNQGQWVTEKQRDNEHAAANKAAADSGKAASEFDEFKRNQNIRNQQLWDEAKKDIRNWEGGKDKVRQVDGAFVFTPGNRGFGGGLGGNSRFGQTGFQSGPTRFGGGGGSGSFHGGSVTSPSFMGAFGSGSFGTTNLRGNRGGGVVGGQGQYY